MRNIRSLCVLLVLAAWSCGGCASEEGIDARYAMERTAWEARMAETAIWRNPFAVGEPNLDAAIAAYEIVLAENPLNSPESRGWSEDVRMDIRELRLASTASLARLYFIRLQDNASVAYLAPEAHGGPRSLSRRPDLGLSLVASIYGGVGRDASEERCSSLLQDIARDHLIWVGALDIGDTLLSMPGYLARVERGRNRDGSAGAQLDAADRFLKLIVETYPESYTGLRARMARAELYAVFGRFEDALSEIDAVLARRNLGVARDEALLRRGEILAHGLQRYSEAESVLTLVRSGGAGGPAARAADIELAFVRIKTAREQEGMRILRAVELAEDARAEIRATAMLLRADCLLERGDWAESQHILWRSCRLFPFTRASMIAPLVVLRRELATKGPQKAAEVRAKVEEFYVSIIERSSDSWRHRNLVQDHLIESYLILGDPLGAARMLERRAPSWAAETGSVGMLKSAMIYLNLLGDQENGVRMLKKCLDAFPRTRYSRVVRGQLETVSHRRAVE
jgi:tetratricopeptide (TPR) repeat protein